MGEAPKNDAYYYRIKEFPETTDDTQPIHIHHYFSCINLCISIDEYVCSDNFTLLRITSFVYFMFYHSYIMEKSLLLSKEGVPFIQTINYILPEIVNIISKLP